MRARRAYGSREVWALLYRLLSGAFLLAVTSRFFADPPYPAWWNFGFFVAALICQAFAVRGLRTPSGRAPVEVRPPVTGRWTALNSPANRVPSHGTAVYGQMYAIDIVAEGEGEGEGEDGTGQGAGSVGALSEGVVGRRRPAFALFWPFMRPPSSFPGFGVPLLAVADATVVHASDGQRDHLSRTSVPALLYLLAEGTLRDFLGPGRVVGNRIVLDLGDGVFALYAHVRRGSLRVAAGDRVRAGQQLGACGNSGNTTEPHVHFQLMDRPGLTAARGLPFTWTGIGIPANSETFTVPAAYVGP
ncbi:M23 family metallopeptidase [Streptomyces sp. NPDC007088]|uniref:M23 family metallopeptidase n=1 Tax=Streptomyces sp. NPDC007088 TaxID=3364773 RepID=UPI00369A5392